MQFKGVLGRLWIGKFVGKVCFEKATLALDKRQRIEDRPPIAQILRTIAGIGGQYANRLSAWQDAVFRCQAARLPRPATAPGPQPCLATTAGSATAPVAPNATTPAHANRASPHLHLSPA